MTRSLAVDLGGSHVRLRLLEGDAPPPPPHVIETRRVGSFEEAVERWREHAGVRGRLDAIAIAAAGPVAGGRVRITNLGWTLEARTIARRCDARSCLLVNDVTAIAWALPSLRGASLRALAPGSLAAGPPCSARESAAHLPPGPHLEDGPPGSGSGSPHHPGTRAVIAPGTGLGVSGLVPAPVGDFIAIEGEGGHRTLAAQTPREWAIVGALAERFGHASAERALSGPGIEAVWRALASLDGVRCDRDKTAAEIAEDAFARSDPIAEETIAAFTAFLGSVAGDLALVLGARAGVYIAGGIVPGWGERFDAERFLERFRAKGRFRAYLSAVPVHVVTHPCPGLAGVERLLSRRAGGQ